MTVWQSTDFKKQFMSVYKLMKVLSVMDDTTAVTLQLPPEVIKSNSSVMPAVIVLKSQNFFVVKNKNRGIKLMAKQLNLLSKGQVLPALHTEMQRSYLEYTMSNCQAGIARCGAIVKTTGATLPVRYA